MPCQVKNTMHTELDISTQVVSICMQVHRITYTSWLVDPSAVLLRLLCPLFKTVYSSELQCCSYLKKKQ